LIPAAFIGRSSVVPADQSRKSAPVPTYDYQCRSCGNTFEVIHPMSEDGPQTCEICGGELRRILHPAGIIFKGSGFYKTDSRSSSSASVPSGSKPAPSSADAAATRKPEGPSKGSGDAKPSGSGGAGSAPPASD
jgi:putative FmdB family regulatory protein